jgi:hypothetical protein
MMPEPELAFVASATGAASARRGERIQSLWSGYGELFRVHLEGGSVPSVVVKAVRPPRSSRSSRDDASHRRKCRSYEIEATFYRTLARRCDDACRVPGLFASRIADGDIDLVLEDLDASGFPRRRRGATPREMDRCLSWLAALHACFLGERPVGLWEVGTYWHLATRADELAAMDDDELRRAAPILDERLRHARFQTIVHGDAKLANFCFPEGEGGVAAVDFQYVGGGPGVKDVAYLLSGHFEDDALERRALDVYFAELRRALTARGREEDVDTLEAEWRALYPIACADFYRFLAGWAKEHFRSDPHARAVVRRVLATL